MLQIHTCKYFFSWLMFANKVVMGFHQKRTTYGKNKAFGHLTMEFGLFMIYTKFPIRNIQFVNVIPDLPYSVFQLSSLRKIYVALRRPYFQTIVD